MTPRTLLKLTAVTLALAGLLCLSLAQTARVYNGLNQGVAWDWGGYEWVGQPGPFVCGFATPDNGLLPAQQLVNELFPGFLVDC